jgi:hypothetical protein
MPSQLALTLAQQIKNTIDRFSNNDIEPIPVEQWFCPVSTNTGFGFREIPYSSISYFADQEYSQWRRVHDDFVYHFDGREKLIEWVNSTSKNDIAALLDKTPPGVDNDKFTPWQRLSMIFWLSPPYAITSKITISTETLRQFARSFNGGYVARKQPIMAEFSRLEGSSPDVGIIDLPTASWKTAWSLAVAYMTLSPQWYTILRSEFRNKMLGSIFQGPICIPMARMCIVAVSGGTFDHFVTNLNRSILTWSRMDPSLEFIVWTTLGKNHSVRLAATYPEHVIVFWVIPVSKLNTVLRDAPDVAIAVCITDEYIVDTPRERFRSMHSKVMKHMITQATPQALVQATSGSRSMLKEVFSGCLIPPHTIDALLQNRYYSQAQLACEQLCQLNLMTLTHFRDLIRKDLETLVPKALHVHFLKSRRFTLSSLLLEMEVDMIPASFGNVLMKCVRDMLFTEGVRQFQQNIQVPVLTPQTVISELKKLQYANQSAPQHTVVKMERLISRIREFAMACPICFSEDVEGMNIFGCCGYCVCNVCFDACKLRCAFCRKTVPSSLRRQDVTDDTPPDTNDEVYPVCLTLPTMNTLHDNLKHVCSYRYKQVTNLTLALQVLVHHKYTRFLIVIERDVHTYGNLGDAIDIKRIVEVSGIQITRVDMLMTGKGTEFTKVKKRFDTVSTTPLGMLSYGMDPNLLIGTNFDYVDVMVTVGRIKTNILTQAINRVFRPRSSRNNSRPMTMVKIYS